VQTGVPATYFPFSFAAHGRPNPSFVDGIPFNQGLSGAFNFADFTNDNIGRIEVIRGRQSALYGSQASAGDQFDHPSR